jgi:hypothetical protein
MAELTKETSPCGGSLIGRECCRRVTCNLVQSRPKYMADYMSVQRIDLGLLGTVGREPQKGKMKGGT